MLPLITVSLRLTPTLLAQIDHAAAARGMTRSDWMRAALLEQLQATQRYEDLQALEQRLLARLDDMQASIVHHVTVEIDSLTHG
jgi:metal-responsive CopG/Arc/MetJ family transcriptional regulator